MEPEHNDQLALLTSIDDPNTSKPKKRRTSSIIWAVLLSLFIILIVLLLVFVFDDKTSSSRDEAGMFGFWPTYGGGLKNQQISPKKSNILTPSNVHNLSIKCVYDNPNGTFFMGYITIDDENNAYLSGGGYITSIDLETCTVRWTRNIKHLLGINNSNITITSHQSLTIFRDSQKTEGLLFGAPSFRAPADNYPYYPYDLGCYALAVYLNNGSFWWKIQIGQDYKGQDYGCTIHGFYVDGNYGYGGFGQSCCYNNRRISNGGKSFIGRFVKIDIDKHEVVNTWYTYNYNLTNQLDEYNLSFSGITLYNYPAIDDEYVAFGTSNAWTAPYKMQECMVLFHDKNYNELPLLLNESVTKDICGNDQSSNLYYRCMPNDIYPDSLIILDKETFKLKHAFRQIGLDFAIGEFGPKIGMLNSSHFGDNSTVNRTDIIGFNHDLTAVAIYKNKFNGKKYVAAANKAAIISVFELETGKLYFTKKYGPRSITGQFNMAIDEEHLIGITTMTGGLPYGRWKLTDNLIVCEGTGVVIAFDLMTGKILWEIINPYGTINESICYNDTQYKWQDEMEQMLSHNICEKSVDDDDDGEDGFLLHIPPKSNETFDAVNSKERAKFRAPITIHNDMVFIPTDTGDIFVHHLVNGSFIHRFVCPPKLYNNTIYNRPAIKGGVSIANDRLVVYCGGSYWYGSLDVIGGNTFMLLQL